MCWELPLDIYYLTITYVIATILSFAQGKLEMYGKLLLRILAVIAYFIVDARAVSNSVHQGINHAPSPPKEKTTTPFFFPSILLNLKTVQVLPF